MSELDRRFFLAAAPAAALAATLAGAALAAAAPLRRRRLIVNALGALDDPNDWSESDRAHAVGEVERKPVSPRILRDARAAGLDAI
ncbi:MAG: hypothetical protein ACJ8EB_03190, partial [Allosphingosinicella sp.]